MAYPKVSRILQWIADDLTAVDDLVKALEAAAGQDADYAAAYVLVAESATNILTASTKVSQAASHLSL